MSTTTVSTSAQPVSASTPAPRPVTPLRIWLRAVSRVVADAHRERVPF